MDFAYISSYCLISLADLSKESLLPCAGRAHNRPLQSQTVRIPSVRSLETYQSYSIVQTRVVSSMREKLHVVIKEVCYRLLIDL